MGRAKSATNMMIVAKTKVVIITIFYVAKALKCPRILAIEGQQGE